MHSKLVEPFKLFSLKVPQKDFKHPEVFHVTSLDKRANTKQVSFKSGYQKFGEFMSEQTALITQMKTKKNDINQEGT